MKLGSVTKLYRKNTITSKKMKSFQKIVTSLSIFQFMANLEQSGSRMSDAWSVKLRF